MSLSPNLVALLYLVSGVLFILALRGLSSPESSRQGNTYGMIGMAIAIATTLGVARPEDNLSWAMIAGGIALGGGIGAYIARKIAMTAMPQLVAAFHSLVGLAAVCVAAAALNAPEAFGIGSTRRDLYAKPDRDVDRRRHRRGHILGLAHRVREAQRQHVGQADPVARAPYDQPWSRGRSHCPDRAFRSGGKPGTGPGSGQPAVLGYRGRAPSYSASCSSSPSAAPTCRWWCRC